MSRTTLLTPEQEHVARFNQLCRVFSLTDSTLASRNIACSIMTPAMKNQANDAPAASNGKQIFFNADRVNDVRTADGLVIVNGLNYHELSHILFTPSDMSPLWKKVFIAKHGNAFNILEDQRIETLLSTQYPSVIPYFVATVAEYFANVPASRHQNTWPYLYGRKYLPTDMRKYFRTLYNDIDAGTCAQIESIVGEYVATNVHAPKNEERVLHLISEFARLTGDMNEFMPFGHDGDDAKLAQGTDGGNETAKALAEGEKSDGTGEAGEASDEQGQSAGGKGGDEDPADGDGKGSDGEPEDGDPGEGLLGGDGDSGSDGDADGEPTAGTSDRAWDSNPKEALQQVASTAATTDVVLTDIRHQREAMGDGKRFMPNLPPVTDAPDAVPSVAAVKASKKFAIEIQRLVADIDPGWHTHQSSGRVNVGRLLGGGDRDSVFDVWNAGKQDADSVEIVVMLDVSGSMQERMRRASEAMWAIKNGVELGSANSQCTVMAFSTTARYLYSPGENLKKGKMKNLGAGGGTDPGEATHEALRIFQNSKRRRKIAMFITDGSWNDGWATGGLGMIGPRSGSQPARGAEQSIRMMNASGITTACVFIGQPLGGNPSHGCRIFGSINNPADLVGIAKKIVKASIKS